MTAGWLLAARNQNNFCCPPQYGRTSRRRYVEKKFVLFAFDLRCVCRTEKSRLAVTYSHFFSRCTNATDAKCVTSQSADFRWLPVSTEEAAYRGIIITKPAGDSGIQSHSSRVQSVLIVHFPAHSRYIPVL